MEAYPGWKQEKKPAEILNKTNEELRKRSRRKSL
jgi:hypothetical protein